MIWYIEDVPFNESYSYSLKLTLIYISAVPLFMKLNDQKQSCLLDRIFVNSLPWLYLKADLKTDSYMLSVF